MLPLRVRVELASMAINRYSVFIDTPALLEPNHQMSLVLSRTFVGGVLSLCRDAISVFYISSQLGHVGAWTYMRGCIECVCVCVCGRMYFVREPLIHFKFKWKWSHKAKMRRKRLYCFIIILLKRPGDIAWQYLYVQFLSSLKPRSWKYSLLHRFREK